MAHDLFGTWWNTKNQALCAMHKYANTQRTQTSSAVVRLINKLVLHFYDSFTISVDREKTENR